MAANVELVGPGSAKGISAPVVGCAVADEGARETPPVLDLVAIPRNIIPVLDNDKTAKRRALKRSVFHLVYRAAWQKVTGFSVFCTFFGRLCQLVTAE